MSKDNALKSKILQYCNSNGDKLDKMTTPEIASHLKETFKGAPVMAIVSAMGEWCTKHRPKIAG